MRRIVHKAHNEKEETVSNEKRTMTLNLTDAEMSALEQMAEQKDISKTAVLRQALRLYQLIDVRQQQGERIYFENDLRKQSDLIVLM